MASTCGSLFTWNISILSLRKIQRQIRLRSNHDWHLTQVQKLQLTRSQLHVNFYSFIVLSKARKKSKNSKKNTTKRDTVGFTQNRKIKISLKFWPDSALLTDKTELILKILSNKSPLTTSVIYNLISGNIRVLGQYKVSYIEEGSVKSCMSQTVCRPCQRFNKFYLTITNECLLFSD